MQRIMQILGPEGTCLCAGCRWEVNEAIKILRTQGIEYQKRGHDRTMPSHEPDQERRGNGG